MPVSERVMALGDWSVTLRADTPKSIRDSLTALGSIVVTPAQIDPTAVSDAGLLATARYTGVCLRPGPQYELSGAGMAWWAGDANGHGDVITTAVTLSGVTFQSAVSSLQPTYLEAGDVEAAGGSYTNSFYLVTRRQALDTLCAYFGREWRVNPDLTVDAGSISNLYSATPSAIAVRKGGGKDLVLTGVESDMAVLLDYDQYATKVVVAGRSQVGTATGTSHFKSPKGDSATLTKLFEASYDAAPGTEADTATNLLNLYNVSTGRRDLTLRSGQYDIRGAVDVGKYLYVYDLDLGLVDTTNQVSYQGQVVFPAKVRVVGMRWPIERGMGVYYRTKASALGSATYVDLSPYVEWETGGSELEVVSGGDAARWQLGGTSSARADPTSQLTDRVALGKWDTYTPSWTGSGSNPSIGDGTITGHFRREGTTGEVRIHIEAGSTTTYGSGFYGLSLPSGWTAAASGEQGVGCKLYQPGTNWLGWAILGAGGSGFSPYFPTSSGDCRLTTWTATSPATFANGGNFHLQGTIELAP
jgi:hypothetical protein